MLHIKHSPLRNLLFLLFQERISKLQEVRHTIPSAPMKLLLSARIDHQFCGHRRVYTSNSDRLSFGESAQSGINIEKHKTTSIGITNRT